MSIAIIAPQKFAYQDLVCIETMLRFCAHDDATLLVEPDGGEDAELTFTAGGRLICCEIQVKGAAGAIGLAEVAAWDHITFAGDGERVARIIADVGAESAERALGILLRLKVGCTGNFIPEAWAALLRLAADPDEYARWLDRMVEASPAILDDISDLTLWLSEENDLRTMLDKLQNDFLPLEMTKIVFDPPEDVDAGELQENAVKVLAFLCRERLPLLFGTCDRLISRLERATIDTAEFVETLRARRTAIFAEREIIKVAMERADPPLVGWIDP